MNPYVENLIVSAVTGLGVSAGAIAGVQPGQARDYVILAAMGVAAFCGAFINGMRQLQKDPPGTTVVRRESSA